ncbi:hypothetical protein CONPUDRAFT_83082 [Coniophora puteana RWD-64-598 SS2]|uniref:Uncharacterized protein n=1 Tax=Coniophora puteana (strain RWD-64-598) TaxID=741705 RepID=A0A5M3MKU8_CONPW|nr:uncharacterized protein CONPUDRAFT_83082 [Coniophora puteana RWD-64-598 SS2]EIW79788.1 hypothetical protein CONPUDRAFT_83082 [Coniophora puteana RWD-64-598 SS2]
MKGKKDRTHDAHAASYAGGERVDEDRLARGSALILKVFVLVTKHDVFGASRNWRTLLV